MSLPQLRFAMPVAGLEPISLADANAMVTRWGHNLGACRRPFGSDCWALMVDSTPVSVAISASTVSEHVTESVQSDDGKWVAVRQWRRGEIVELARLCSDPAQRWATRPMLRLWREVAARRWPYWPVTAAVAYSQKRRHDGDLYRWDGWQVAAENCGSSGGGTWSRKRYTTDEVHGPKRLWVWQYPDNETRTR